MATRRLNDLLGSLHLYELSAARCAQTDGQLLECFLDQRDESAFGALLKRHGPMVLGVCRRVLRNVDDAEDAFQATFLVLIRRASSIMPRDQVGNWLYGVAYRTSLEARTLAQRRRIKERQAAFQTEPLFSGNDYYRDWLPLLDQELSRLPTKYRTAIVLCDLEGKSHKEAARLLGWPEGTLSTRLIRGRAHLAKRMVRHGLTLMSGAVAGTFSQVAKSAVPPSLAAATLESAMHIAFGTATTAGALSATVGALMEGVLRTMWIAKLKIVTGVLLALLALGTGTGFWLYPGLPAAKAQSNRSSKETLRQENEHLKRELQQTKQHAATLQAKLTALGEGPEPVLYGGKPASFWIKQLKDRSPAFRKEAAIALGGIAEVDKAMMPVFIGALNDPSQTVQFAVVQAVRDMGPNAQATIPFLIEAMNDPKNAGSRAAAQILSDIRPRNPKAIAALLDAIHGKDKKLAQTALYNLVRADLPAALPVLLEGLKKNEPAIKEQILALFGFRMLGPGGKLRPSRPSQFGGNDNYSNLKGLVNENDPGIRRDAAEVLKILNQEAESKPGETPKQ